MMSNVAFAALGDSINSICKTTKDIVPVVALLMFIMAGGIYAIGQVLGAETRARASVWATAMLVGGIIGLIIAASASFFVSAFAQSIGSGSSLLSTTDVTC